MILKEELKYSKSHEWIALDGDTAVVGLTDYAQSELGDLVFVNLPEEGDSITTEDGLRLVVESLDKNRIESVHAYLPEPSVETEDDASDS